MFFLFKQQMRFMIYNLCNVSMIIGKEIVILKILSTTKPTQYVYLAIFVFKLYNIYIHRE